MKTVSFLVSPVVRALAVAGIAASAGCGGDDGPPNSPSGGGGGPVQVSGSERFGWVQRGPSLGVVQQYRFYAYVDGVRSLLANAQCRSGSGGNFDCSAPLPRMSSGTHSLSLSTADTAGVESVTSEALLLNVGARATTTSSTLAPDAAQVPRLTCPGTTSRPSCYDVDLIAEKLVGPSDLLPLGSGRLLFLEQNSRVFVLSRDELLEAYQVERASGATIEAIALDADFESTRHVYAAIATTREGMRSLSIVRFREVAGTLGEEATIVPDLPMALDGMAGLSVGGDRDLYVVLPASGGRSDPNGHAGTVLRFDALGAAKGLPRMASPLLAQSSPRPAKVAWRDNHLWFAGLADPASPVLSRLSTRSDVEPLPIRPAGIDLRRWPQTSSGIRDLAPLPVDQRTSNLLVVQEDPRTLSWVIVDNGTGQAVSMTNIDLGSFRPEAVAVSVTGDIYVAGGIEPGAAGILRLRPTANRQALPR